MNRACASCYQLSTVGLNMCYLVPLEAEAQASIEYWHDLEIWVRGSFKVIEKLYHSKAMVWLIYSNYTVFQKKFTPRTFMITV